MKITNSEMHHLKLEVISPSTITVDQEFKITFKFTNAGSNPFPGMILNIRRIWANLDANNIHVDRTFAVEKLELKESYETTFSEKPRIDGMLLFYLHGFDPKALSKSHVEFLRPNNNPLKLGSIFHVIRVQSSEEKSQNLANWLAVIALGILIIFQLLDWYLQGVL